MPNADASIAEAVAEAAAADRDAVTALGIDAGQSVTDAVALGPRGDLLRHHALGARGREIGPALDAALGAIGPHAAAVVGVTGGRSATLAAGPTDGDRPAIVAVPEPEAIGRGGLHLAALAEALVVSCGTGTAMIAARAADHGRSESYVHATGTPVGGGTLRALGRLLLGSADTEAIATLAAQGDAARIDTTLADVLGGGLGTLPPDATAVSLGRLADDAERGDLDLEGRHGDRADLAAALVTMIAQTIAIVAVNAVRAHDLPAVVMVGRVATLPSARSMLQAVFRVYGASDALHLPTDAAAATAIGAALAAQRRHRAA